MLMKIIEIQNFKYKLLITPVNLAKIITEHNYKPKKAILVQKTV